MTIVKTLDQVCTEINEFVESEMRRLGQRGEPLTQEILEAIRESAQIALDAQLQAAEYIRDSFFRKAERFQQAVEVSPNFRDSLKG